MKELVLILLKDSVSAFAPSRFSTSEDIGFAKALAAAGNLNEVKDVVARFFWSGGMWIEPFDKYFVDDGKINLFDLLETHVGGVVYIKTLVSDVSVGTPLDVVKIRKDGVVAIMGDKHKISFY